MSWLRSLNSWGAFALFLLLGQADPFAAPGILITNLPAYGSTANLGGLVLNADPRSYAVAVFIFVPGYGWVTKPTCAQPLAVIRPDGTWTADITTGGADTQATRIAALLVSTNFHQPCVQGGPFLTNAFSEAVASAIVTRPYPGVRWLSFSGYDWLVKSSAAPVGPGPNYFSDSTNNVWVDAVGQLHVRLTNRSNQWQCAEIISARTFGYGSYRFELQTRVDNLDPNVVLGLFTWSDDPVYAHREMDIEFSRWSYPPDPNNSQYTVQPYTIAGHFLRYAEPPGVTNSTHLFAWQTNQIFFESLRGPYSPNPPGSSIIRSWTYTLAVPQTGDENARVNLWLNAGTPPSNNSEVEIILRSYQFVPPGVPAPALLTNFARLPNGAMRFKIKTEPDRRYLVQSSGDCAQWQDLSTLLATLPWVDFTDTNAAPGVRFYRVQTLP